MSRENIQTETAHSLSELNELVAKLEQSLSVGDATVEGPDKFWYRGVDDGSYTLTPSLYRYHDPIEKERMLFELHNQIVPGNLGNKDVSWERVIHMQHYNIPTRLLDWTANLWIAVFFALTSAPTQPCIYILNPLRLNRKGGLDKLVHVPSDSHFDFKEHFFGKPILSPDLPLAVIPSVPNERQKCQNGRFTVQCRKPEPLEQQTPECLARINLSKSSHAELRAVLPRIGIYGHNVFPDYEGIAQFVKAEAHLEEFRYDENIASRILSRLADRAKQDVDALIHREMHIEPCSKGISFCHLNEAYLSRETEAADMAAWFKDGPPFYFITGEAGVGKTNFTLHTLLCHDDFKEKPSVFFSFKLYGSGLAHVVRDDGIGNLSGYLYDIMLGYNHSEQERHVARQMISEGDVVLALDGLDELARIRGAEAVEEVGRELDWLFGGSPKARVIITCRDHILARLKETGVLGKTKNQRELKLKPFLLEIIGEALTRQLGQIPESLVKMACIPLFYEMIRRSWDKWSVLLRTQDKRTRLEEVWFNVILQENNYSALDLRKLGAIAGRMLQDRSDLLKANSMPGELKALLRELSRYPFALFVEELKDTYSFSHQSLREFILAWCVAKEIKTHSFDLLKSSSSFDYEGHEFYDRVRDLLDIKDNVINQLGYQLDFRGLDEGEQNHLIRNLFEMLGELTPDENDLTKRIAEAAMPYLKPTMTKAGYITYKTKYNIVRCLERIHWSAPMPYIDHIPRFSWWWDPLRKPLLDEYYIYAYAIRGFHRPRQVATSSPPMVYKKTEKSTLMREIEEVISDRLMAVIERLREHEIPEDGIFLGINCTFALIRWLPMDPDLDRIEGLLQWRHIDWRMKQNLFYALFVRYGALIPERFRKRGLFRDAGELNEKAVDEMKEAFQYLISDDSIK